MQQPGTKGEAEALFDYIIVGGGSAGAVAAHGLATLPGAAPPTVLLLEAGPTGDRDPLV